MAGVAWKSVSRKFLMACVGSGSGKWVPWYINVVCHGWKEILHVGWLSSSLAAYFTNKKAELREGEVAVLNRTSPGLSQSLSLPWESRTCEHKAGGAGTQWCAEAQSWGARGKGREGLGGCKMPQSGTTQTHTWLSVKQEFLLDLPPSLFPEHVKSRWKLPGKWQNFPTDLQSKVA